MPCRDCGPSAKAVIVGDCRVFRCPLDGAEVEIVVKGQLTSINMTLVKQYLGFVFDVLQSQATEGV